MRKWKQWHSGPFKDQKKAQIPRRCAIRRRLQFINAKKGCKEYKIKQVGTYLSTTKYIVPPPRAPPSN